MLKELQYLSSFTKNGANEHTTTKTVRRTLLLFLSGASCVYEWVNDAIFVAGSQLTT